ncbi:hypothetical protein D3C86_1667950 [compost metagenome]
MADCGFFREMQIFNFYIIHSVRVNSYQKHCWEQDFQSVSFMETDEDFEEILGVISAHKWHLNAKIIFIPLKFTIAM